MPIGPTSGFLDFTNATPRADVIVALSKIGIGTDAPLHALDLRGTANVADIIINNDLTLTGGLITNTLTINNVSMSTTTNFQQVTNGTGNVTTNTIEFNNPTTGLVVASNVGIGIASPTYKLDVGDTAPYISVTDTRTSSGGVSGLDMGGIVFRTKDATDPVPETGDFLGKIQMTATNTESFPDGSMNFFVSNRGDLLTTPSITIEGVSGNVGVGTSEPTESLDIVGNLNLQKVSNTASIKLNSNVVTEYTRSKKLIKYPRVALTSAASNAYENGYKITYSHEYPIHQAWEAFNNDPSDTVGWYSGTAAGTYYNGTGGNYSGTTQLASETELGEWIGLEVPSPIKLYDVRIVAQSYSAVTNTVDDFVIYAKKQSGDTWTNLGKFTGIAALQGTAAGVTVNVISSDYYKFFALVATKRDSQGVSGVSIRVLDFFGIPEYDPEAHGTDVVVRSVPNVPNTDWLQVYYDARNYSGSGAIQDETTNNRDADMNATFDNGEIKAFNFSGAYTSNVTTSDHGLGTGDVTYTMSFWFKRTAVASTYDYLVLMGNGGSQYQAIVMYITSNTLRLDHWSSQTTVREPIVLNKWYHVVAGHRGGSTPSLTNDFIYIDGLPANVSISGTAAALNLTGSKLTLGSSHYTTTEFFQGSIANFRLFNRALTGDEVWQLYAYQKEYFDVSPDVVTFKGGRLGIGTTEPRAPLDVMGIPYGPGVKPCFSVRKSDGDVSASLTIKFNVVEVNQGNGYNSTSGVFSAPIAGLYLFSFYGMSSDTANNYFGVRALKNGVDYEKFWPYTHHSAASPHKHVSGTQIVPMGVGDTFAFKVTGGIMYGGSNSHNSFVGYLIE